MAKEAYDHVAIESAEQAKWEALDLYACDLSETEKEKYYLLFEFPYPSGDLHIGHWYAFALTDIFARYKRMQGKNVLFPIGFDAFGLPAENAAIKFGKDPAEWTYANMERMRQQIRIMGTSVDWSKEVVTCSPEYYKWTQWLFLKLFEQGLAERRLAPVKWCPKDLTVLANEQVIDGHCERCGTEVEEKNLTQWFLTITKYAKRLLDDLDPLPWREEIKDAQRAWIGESEGAKLTFQLIGPGIEPTALGTPVVPVFTTRPDTIYGATYLVLAPEHALVEMLMEKVANPDEVAAYVKKVSKKTDRERQEQKEKTGVILGGITVVNPATKEEIPVYIADYVLASYGTGAVMAVPSHDERDYAFAKKFKLPLRTVISGGNDELYTGTGTLMNSGPFDGRENLEAMGEIINFVNGERVTNYRIRDWLVSRQRYWGCPIPIVYDPEGRAHAVPQEHLPWLLPTDVDFTPTDSSPLSTSKELRERVTRIFGEGWTPECDTLDTFVDSSWYFLRYLDPKNEDDFSEQALMKQWLPVDRYSGGSEHTTMHLLYARFFQKALYDLALVPTSEPFNERFNRGLILGPDGAKMSKSKGNVVNPDEFVGKYGADAVRMYLAFIGPYNEPGSYPWSLEGVFAMRKFLDRVFQLRERIEDTEASNEERLQLDKAIQKVDTDTERFKFNTAISGLMVLVRELEKQEHVSRSVYQDLLRLLAPYAPHLADSVWQEVGGEEESVHQALWPEAGARDAVTAPLIVQVNGKRRGEVHVDLSATEEEVLAAARGIETVAKALHEGTLMRTVYVKGRILNLVITQI
ncbi:MAG: leucyl-tRNA synthetase [Parcubacteria bacterium C7867-004]|nr:MAG: leucyl-tRNA synthetase [Parcubacteria bacterium C7867-004]